MSWNTSARRRLQAGSITLTIVVLLSGISVVTLALLSVTMTQVRITKAGNDRATGLTVAEAGVDASIDALTGDYSTTTVNGTLYEDAAKTRVFGTYSAAITDINVTLGIKKAVSVGTNGNGSTRKVVALISQGTMNLGNAALMSNGAIDLGGGANIATLPAQMHVADVYGNGNVNMTGSGYTDGRLISAGTVNGTAYFPSVSAAPKIPFPDALKRQTMQTDWIAESKLTNNIINANNLFSGSGNSRTITAPAYLNGNIHMTSDKTLTLTGTGVVYVNGNVKITANSVLTNGVTLIVGGSWSQEGQAIYKVTTAADGSQLSPAPTLAVCSGDIGLQGGAANIQWGIVYAVNGGIRVNGNSVFTGALVAHGSITANGTYNQYFPVGMASTVRIPSNPVVTQVIEM